MRTITTALAILMSLANPLSLVAQDASPTKESTNKKPGKSTPAPASSTATPQWLARLSVEEQRKLHGLLGDAAKYLSGIRVQEAFERILEAEALAPEYSAVHNLKGAAYTKIRQFDKATAAFTKALELNPESFMCRFNLTEMHFVKGNFDQAEKGFRQLISEQAKLPESNKALIQFKILICRLKQDDEPGALTILKAWDFLDDHPCFYFGNAAIHFNKDEEKEARVWLDAAKKIYPPGQINLYTDSFIESGWIENFE
jgi:tetratricopeptide (TPR) repeat protein